MSAGLMGPARPTIHTLRSGQETPRGSQWAEDENKKLEGGVRPNGDGDPSGRRPTQETRDLPRTAEEAPGGATRCSRQCPQTRPPQVFRRGGALGRWRHAGSDAQVTPGPGFRCLPRGPLLVGLWQVASTTLSLHLPLCRMGGTGPFSQRPRCGQKWDDLGWKPFSDESKHSHFPK